MYRIDFSDRIDYVQLSKWMSTSNSLSYTMMRKDKLQYYGNGLDYTKFCGDGGLHLPEGPKTFDILNNWFEAVPVIARGTNVYVYITMDVFDRYVTISTFDHKRYNAHFAENKAIATLNNARANPLDNQITRRYHEDKHLAPIQPLHVIFNIGSRQPSWKNIIMCLRSNIAYNMFVGSDAQLLFSNVP